MRAGLSGLQKVSKMVKEIKDTTDEEVMLHGWIVQLRELTLKELQVIDAALNVCMHEITDE